MMFARFTLQFFQFAAQCGNNEYEQKHNDTKHTGQDVNLQLQIERHFGWFDSLANGDVMIDAEYAFDSCSENRI